MNMSKSAQAIIKPSVLRCGRLGPGQAVAATAGGVALAALAFWLTPLQGRAGFLLVTYLAGTTATCSPPRRSRAGDRSSTALPRC